MMEPIWFFSFGCLFQLRGMYSFTTYGWWDTSYIYWCAKDRFIPVIYHSINMHKSYSPELSDMSALVLIESQHPFFEWTEQDRSTSTNNLGQVDPRTMHLMEIDLNLFLEKNLVFEKKNSIFRSTEKILQTIRNQVASENSQSLCSRASHSWVLISCAPWMCESAWTSPASFIASWKDLSHVKGDLQLQMWDTLMIWSYFSSNQKRR